MPTRITRRVWLAAAATVPPLLAQKPDRRLHPELGPKLNRLWERALGEKANNTAEAVIVSSVEYARLPALRGWRDERFLNAYIAWADRPETAAFDGTAVTAELGPYDSILIRRPASFVHAVDAPHRPDPIGYLLIEPGAGRHRLKLEWSLVIEDEKPLLPLKELSLQPVPDLDAAVAVSSDVVTLYGAGFEGGRIEVVSEGGAGTVLYASPNQVNARVPSLDRVQLVIDGMPTAWVAVKKR